MEITLEDVKAFIDSNKTNADVVEYLVSVAVDKPLNPELVSAYLQTTEGKNLIQPMMDQRVTDAIKTHDEKQKPKIDAAIKSGIAAEMLRLNPQETPEQRRLRELEEKDRLRDQEWENEKLRGKIKEIAFKEGIDPTFIEGIPFPSTEEATLYIQRFKEHTGKTVEKEVNERIAASSYKPNGGKGKEDGGPNIAAMSPTERFEYFKKQAESREAAIA